MRPSLVAALVFFAAVISTAAQENTSKCDFENFRVPIPKVYDTSVNGINGSQTIVGSYTVPKKCRGGYWVPISHGFMRSNGKYYPIDVPGRATQPLALNDRGQIVGDSWPPRCSGPPKAFLLDDAGYHELNFPGYYDIFALGIDNQGVIVGSMTSSETNAEVGFLLESQRLHIITFPGSAWSFLIGRNEHGDMVGNYGIGDAVYHGFMLRDGAFTTLDYPGAYETILWAINDEDVVTGSYETSAESLFAPFKWDAAGFEDLPYDYGNKMRAIQTNFVSVNDSGHFAGNFYVDQLGYTQGFVATCR